jgi:hypothetical protein
MNNTNKKVKSMKTLQFCLIIFLLSICSAQVYAWQLSYDESVDGDLDGSNLLQLGVGTNIVSGTICNGSGVASCPQDFDFDTFSFLLPSDGALTKISMAFTLDNWGAAFPGALYAIFPFTLEEPVYFPEPSPELLFTTYFPILSVDPVTFSHTTLMCGCFPGDVWFASYQLQLEVTQNVPAPGSFALLLLAAMALWLHRQRAAQFAK